MNIENYFAASKVIHETMAQIATTTYTMAWSNCADRTNPQFVGLMNLHEQLVERFNKLHAEFVSTNQSPPV